MRDRNVLKSGGNLRAQTTTLLPFFYPVIGNLPVTEIRPAHALQIVEPIWQDKPKTMSLVRGRIQTLLGSGLID